LSSGIEKAQAQPAPSGQQPNIIVIMGDDIGWSNIGVYNQGIMAGRTPNLDRMASEGMRFTDYYAEASCTAGRANFITGDYQSEPVSRRLDKPAPLPGCRRKRQPSQQC
jgi:arylsulfatase A-like enzyme